MASGSDSNDGLDINSDNFFVVDRGISEWVKNSIRHWWVEYYKFFGYIVLNKYIF